MADVSIRPKPNGPYLIEGAVDVYDTAGNKIPTDDRPRIALCRCGASANKPFCDGTHSKIGFSATGEPPSGKTDMLPTRDGVLAIDPQPNGPLRVRGNLEIMSGTGRVVARVTSAYLCRCGGSGNK